MDMQLVRALEELRGLAAPALQHKYQEVFGRESKSTHKQFLFRRLAWQLQAQAEGGLSKRAQQRATAIADESDLRSGSRKGFWSWAAKSRSSSQAAPSRDGRLPQPGAQLRRKYQGRDVVVRVLDNGFEYQGRHFRSLSAIAREVTGTRWNGLLFFGVAERPRG